MAFQSGQNCQQFSLSKPVPISWSNNYFLWSKLIFVVKIDFLMFRPANFLVKSRNILVTKFLGQSLFHSNAKISCSTLFHSNFMLNSVPFQQHFMVTISWSVTVSIYLHPMSATPSYLTSVSFECSLGTVTILH